MAEDIQLLRQYAESRAEDAFAALVQRHISFVYAAARRQLGGAAHRAEDVTQTVFIQLAGQAAALARRDEIVGWLYTTTHYAAAALKRAEARRERREQEAQTMHELEAGSSHDEEWLRLRPVLDDALLELSEADRQAVLRRFFRNERFADIGRNLGLSEDGARMRVDRALDKLHALLAKRGITSTTAALSVVLANQPIVAAPAGLAASVMGAVLNGGVATLGYGSLAACLRFMNASKITLSLAAVAAFATGFALYQSSRANTTSIELVAARADRAALAATLAEVQTNIGRAEQELQARTAALEQQRSAASRTADAAAAANAEKARQAKALQQLLANDPQLQQMWRDSARQWWLFSWSPFFQRLRLTPAEIEQTLAELQRRADLKIGSTTSGVGFPDALAADACFMESQRHPAEAFLVGNIVQYAATEGMAFTPEQTEQLFKTFVELRPASLPPYANFPMLQAAIDWAQVITQAGAYLEPAQLNKLVNRAARMSRDKILEAATQAAP